MPSEFKRFIALGCTHGELLDRDAFAAVMGFVSRYKPETRIHLGDLHDYAALRSGAKGTSDEARDLDKDISAGAQLIDEYRPTHLLLGNHDIRAWKLADHHDAIVAKAARAIRNEFLTAIAKHNVHLIDHYDINRSYLQLGDAKCVHGFMYGENAIRDHAEHFGKVILAQLHTPGIAYGRRLDHPAGYCVGTLANVPMMEYANTRRATARWGHGYVWGEYNDTECHINLCHAPQGQAGAWRMPF